MFRNFFNANQNTRSSTKNSPSPPPSSSSGRTSVTTRALGNGSKSNSPPKNTTTALHTIVSEIQAPATHKTQGASGKEHSGSREVTKESELPPKSKHSTSGELNNSTKSSTSKNLSSISKKPAQGAKSGSSNLANVINAVNSLSNPVNNISSLSINQPNTITVPSSKPKTIGKKGSVSPPHNSRSPSAKVGSPTGMFSNKTTSKSPKEKSPLKPEGKKESNVNSTISSSGNTMSKVQTAISPPSSSSACQSQGANSAGNSTQLQAASVAPLQMIGRPATSKLQPGSSKRDSHSPRPSSSTNVTISVNRNFANNSSPNKKSSPSPPSKNPLSKITSVKYSPTRASASPPHSGTGNVFQGSQSPTALPKKQLGGSSLTSRQPVTANFNLGGKQMKHTSNKSSDNIKIEGSHKHGTTQRSAEEKEKQAEFHVREELFSQEQANAKESERPMSQSSKELLHLARNNETEQIMKYFSSKKKANPNAQDQNGWSLLHFACQNKNAVLAKFLLEKEAKIDIEDVNYVTPLMVACAQNAHDVALQLVSAGAETHSVDSKLNTPLHYAAAANSLSCCELLIKKDGEDICEAKNRDNKTPVEMAKSPELKRLFEYLINFKNDEDKKLTKIEIQLVKEQPEEEEEEKLSLSSYNVKAELGKGSFGEVFLAEKKSTKELFAIKVLDKMKINSNFPY